MKRLTRTCLAVTSRASGLLKFVERKAHGRLTILCYHRVLPSEQKAVYPLSDLIVTPESFRQHCTALKRYYEVLPLYEAVERLFHESSNRQPLAAVTFDDGYRDNLTYATPVLRELNLRATFFVITGLVGTEEVSWYDGLMRAAQTLPQEELDRIARDADRTLARGEHARLDHHAVTPLRNLVELAKTMPPGERAHLISELCSKAGGAVCASSHDLIMDWSQLADLVDAGHEIGSHGLNHELLTLQDEHTLDAEVVKSRKLIEENLNQPVVSFAYPNGDVNDRVAQAVASAGYRCAVTTETGGNDPQSDAYYLRRWFIHEERLSGLGRGPSTTLLRMELCGLATRVFRRQSRA